MDHAASRHDKLTLPLPVRAESVGVGRRAAAQFAEEAGCAPETLWRVRLSVSEAITNVVLHAHDPADEDALHHLELVAERDDAACHFTIIDVGLGLRARDDSPGLGLGLALIAGTSDELSLEAGHAGGTVVRMTFQR